MNTPAVFQKRRLLVLVILAVIALLIFNLTRRPLKYEKDMAFITWANGVEESLNGVGESVPAITIHFQLPPMGSEAASEWSISTNDFASENGNAQREKFMRIFNMLRSADVFGLPQLEDGASKKIAIEVVTKDREFHTSFQPSAVSESIQAQNLLKLVGVYSIATPTPAPLDPNRL